MRFQKIVKNVHHNSQKSKIVSSNILFGQSVYYQIKKKKKGANIHKAGTSKYLAFTIN